MPRDNIALYAKEIIGQKYLKMQDKCQIILKKLSNSAVTREVGDGILNFYVENFVNLLICILNHCFRSYQQESSMGI